ncbi:proline-rich protein 2-like [Dipodomys spectabilis]|uniref:proline-rich protein 2-like n=1 Tax=Dipodomys spectabilis TaxID=105255 RepID=UPI001C53433F|nr:proline-rich protein 2-like [Dipodomys spectabilis]
MRATPPPGVGREPAPHSRGPAPRVPPRPGGSAHPRGPARAVSVPRVPAGLPRGAGDGLAGRAQGRRADPGWPSRRKRAAAGGAAGRGADTEANVPPRDLGAGGAPGRAATRPPHPRGRRPEPVSDRPAPRAPRSGLGAAPPSLGAHIRVPARFPGVSLGQQQDPPPHCGLASAGHSARGPRAAQGLLRGPRRPQMPRRALVTCVPAVGGAHGTRVPADVHSRLGEKTLLRAAEGRRAPTGRTAPLRRPHRGPPPGEGAGPASVHILPRGRGSQRRGVDVIFQTSDPPETDWWASASHVEGKREESSARARVAVGGPRAAAVYRRRFTFRREVNI